MDPTPVAQPASQSMDPFGLDDLGSFAPVQAPPPVQVELPVVLTGDKFHGATIKGMLMKENGVLVYKLGIVNNSSSVLSGFMIQLNTNSFGLQPTDQVVHLTAIQPGSSDQGAIPLTQQGAKIAQGPANEVLQIALKTTELNIAYFTDILRLEALFNEEGVIDQNSFLSSWKTLSGTNETVQSLPITLSTAETTIETLKKHNIFLIAHRKVRIGSQD